MTTTAAELGIKVVIDSNAKESFGNIKKGLADVDKEKKKFGADPLKIAGDKKRTDPYATLNMGVMSNVASLGHLAIAYSAVRVAAMTSMAGVTLMLGHEMFEAAERGNAQIRSIANSFTLLDQSSESLANIKRFASATKDELDELAISAGVASEEVVNVFNDVLARGGKTVDQAEKLTESMVMAGKAVPGGASTLAGAFEAIEMGVIRARNPIVGMIAATHTLQGNAKNVAAQMMKMTPAQQMELAEKAIARMAEKMKQAPMTMGQLKTSMSAALEHIFEMGGRPMLTHLLPVAQKVHDVFLRYKQPLEDAAETFGTYVGRAFDILLPVVDEVMSAITTHGAEMQNAFEQATEPLKEVFEYIYDNKSAFAKTFVDVATLIVKAMGMIIQATMTQIRLIGMAAKFIGKTGVLGKDISAGIYGEELGEKSKNIAKMTSGVTPASMTEHENARKDYAKTYAYSTSLGATQEVAAKNYEEGLKKFDATWVRATEDHSAVMSIASQNAALARGGDTDSFITAWKAADKAGDAGAKAYVASFLQHNEWLVDALAKDGPAILGEGFQSLRDELKSVGMRAESDKLGKGKKLDLGLTKDPKLIQNFNGPINVKQDFRDQDPDQIMIMMKREFGKQGINRGQAMLSGINGF